MSENKGIKAPMSQGFIQLISGGVAVETEMEPELEVKKIPANMEFPMLDELEMDVPLFDGYGQGACEFPEDDSDVDFQCLLHVSPTLAVSSLNL